MPAIAPPDILEDDDETPADCAAPVEADSVDVEDGRYVAVEPTGSSAAERIAWLVALFMVLLPRMDGLQVLP
jgi:hypothetical protein